MDLSLAVTPPPADYRAVFRGHFLRCVRLLLGRLRQSTRLPASPFVNQALQALTCAPHVPDSWPDTRSLLLTLAPKMEQAGYRDEWLPYLERGLELSRQEGDLAAEAELHLHLGILHQLRTNYDRARRHLEAGARLFAQRDARRDQARALNRLAYVARLQRRFEETRELVKTAQMLLDGEDEEWAFSYYVLGLAALDRRDWPEAVDFSEKAFGIWQKENNQRLMGRSLACLGVALLSLKKYEQSIVVCRQAIDLFEEINDSIYKAIIQMNLGNVYLILEQPLEALALYQPGRREFNRIQDQFHLAHINHNIGLAYRRLQRWEKAQEAYLQSIEHQQKVGNIALLVDTMDGLGLTYLEQGDPLKAETTFAKALDQLARIEGEPGYEHLLTVLTTHLLLD